MTEFILRHNTAVYPDVDRAFLHSQRFPQNATGIAVLRKSGKSQQNIKLQVPGGRRLNTACVSVNAVSSVNVFLLLLRCCLIINNTPYHN